MLSTFSPSIKCSIVTQIQIVFFLLCLVLTTGITMDILNLKEQTNKPDVRLVERLDRNLLSLQYVRYESVFLFYLFILMLFARFEASGHIMLCCRLKTIPNTAVGNSSMYFVKVMNAKIMAPLAYRTNSMYWDRYVSANSADQDQTASEEAV